MLAHAKGKWWSLVQGRVIKSCSTLNWGLKFPSSNLNTLQLMVSSVICVALGSVRLNIKLQYAYVVTYNRFTFDIKISYFSCQLQQVSHDFRLATQWNWGRGGRKWRAAIITCATKWFQKVFEFELRVQTSKLKSVNPWCSTRNLGGSRIFFALLSSSISEQLASRNRKISALKYSPIAAGLPGAALADYQHDERAKGSRMHEGGI